MDAVEAWVRALSARRGPKAADALLLERVVVPRAGIDRAALGQRREGPAADGQRGDARVHLDRHLDDRAVPRARYEPTPEGDGLAAGADRGARRRGGKPASIFAQLKYFFLYALGFASQVGRMGFLIIVFADHPFPVGLEPSSWFEWIALAIRHAVAEHAAAGDPRPPQDDQGDACVA